jgi:hypothetical protein
MIPIIFNGLLLKCELQRLTNETINVRTYETGKSSEYRIKIIMLT